MNNFDKIIIGAGLYGLYSASFCGKLGQKVLVLEKDPKPFMRATYINQARVHNGYHYPRSLSTAIKSAGYFQRFIEDYPFCIRQSFEQLYATSSHFSWTDAQQFKKFCKDANIRCDEVSVHKYFKEEMCDGAFLTNEYTYDAKLLCDFLLEELEGMTNVTILYNSEVDEIQNIGNEYLLYCKDKSYQSKFVLNATYASVNQILKKSNLQTFGIKYELCEIILCEVGKSLDNLGITVMDGPFFSIMPFGKTGFHSLTSVTFTPHTTSYNDLPSFYCQSKNENCNPEHLCNCNECSYKPHSAWDYMSMLAKKYLKEDLDFHYKNSLFSMKPILKASEIDDSRPTVIKRDGPNNNFVSVLSGKINTVYDLDEVLK